MASSDEIQQDAAIESPNRSNTHSAKGTGELADEKTLTLAVQYDALTERKVRLKIDCYIVPLVALLYLFCFLDRANIGNAKIAGLEEDLSLSGYDYNVAVTAFYVSYIVFEIPSNIICKWMGPGWWIPLITLCFGIASLSTAFVRTLPQLAGVRFVLGIFEAGMMPGIAYYLSRWYRRAELAFRLSLYIVMSPLAGAFGGLLASAILAIDHIGSLHSWRMIFAIEGIITIGLALLGFALLTDQPATAAWLSSEEKTIAIGRVQSERVGTTAVLDKMDRKKLLRGILSPVTISTAIVFLLNNITIQGLAFFLPTIIQSIYADESTIQQQLNTVPPYVVGAFFTVLLPLISWRTDRRQIFIVLSAPMVIVGYSMFLGSNIAVVRYAATFLITSSSFALGPLTNAQVSANVNSDTARSAAIGANVMLGNMGGIISAWSFLPWDGPDYQIGNGLNLAAAGGILTISTLTLLWMKRDNRKRRVVEVEGACAEMSRQEVEDLDWAHPQFRWKI